MTLLVLAALVCACAGLRALQVTDTHLDLFYRVGSDTRLECHTFNTTAGAPRAGQLGDRLCDTPGALMQGVYAWATTLTPDLVLWTGDNGRHESMFAPNRTWAETLQENSIVCGLLLKSFAGVPIVPSIGNNDIPFNHQPINGTYLANLADAWHDAFASDSERAQFAKGGYFARQINSRMLVVSLNTITMAYTGDCNDTTSGASTHLRWLDSVLAATPSSVAVTIIGHVPPILFPPACRAQYAAMSLRYNVSHHVFGHQHSDQYHFVDIKGDVDTNVTMSCHERIAIAVAPSLLPEYNPSLRLYLFDSNMHIADYEQYFIPLEKLNAMPNVPAVIPLQLEYVFSTAYGLSGASLARIETWCALDFRVRTNKLYMARFARYIVVSSNQTLAPMVENQINQ